MVVKHGTQTFKVVVVFLLLLLLFDVFVPTSLIISGQAVCLVILSKMLVTIKWTLASISRRLPHSATLEN